MLDRARRRTLRFGLETVLGLSKKGFFIPTRYAAAADAWQARAYDTLRPLFRAREPAFAAFLDTIAQYADDIALLRGLPPPEPRFEQDWFPRLDAAMLYAFVRSRKPARIVEIGSGHSTRFAARAVRDGALPTHIVAIDPAPRADIGQLGVELVPEPLQAVDPALFGRLAPGDLLLVDSSHVLMPGTDVDLVLNRVLPAAAAGLFVAFHDIFLPAAYPPAWPFTSYNEQTGVAALLQGGYTLEFASAYVLGAMPGALARARLDAIALGEGARESALLLRKL